MHTQTLENTETGSRHFAVDTTFVLFFLAVDFGRSVSSFGLNDLLSAVTLAALLVVPYFLHSDDAKPDFGSWVLGRGLITVFAVALGLAFRQTLGVLLPEMFRFLPMTLLIASAMVCCFIQFFGVMKFRLAR